MKRAPRTPPTPDDRPTGLNKAQFGFCLEYLRNGFNARRAYSVAYPDAALSTAETRGPALLRHDQVRAYLAPREAEHWRGLAMEGDEALARVALDARADVRQLLDVKGHLLRPGAWPDDIANSVEVIDFASNGTITRVRLASKSAARRTILEQTGKLGTPLDALVEVIREVRHIHPGLPDPIPTPALPPTVPAPPVARSRRRGPR